MRAHIPSLYVGNLPFSFTAVDLKNLFLQVAPVKQADILFDRETNRSRGIGFVVMQNATDNDKAIAALDQSEIHGRKIYVSVARQRQ